MSRSAKAGRRPPVWAAASEARLRVRVTPQASRDEVVGWQGETLRVRVAAPPVEGRANASLERLLARALGVPRSAVRVVSGERARQKTVAVAGLTPDDAFARLREPAGP